MGFERFVLCLWLPLLFTACARAPQRQLPNSDTAYLYQWPGYSPTISADGATVVALSNDNAIWLWHPSQNARLLFKIPENYHSDGLAISSDGQTVAGLLAPDGENLFPQVLYPGRNNKIFLWRASAGVQMLPEIPAINHLGGITVNDAGNEIVFGCTDRRSVPALVVACRDGPFAGSKNFPYDKLWTSGHGYQNINLPNGESKNLTDFIPGIGGSRKVSESLDNIAGDFHAYLLDQDSPGTGCRSVLLAADGKQTPIPLPGNFRPCLTIYTSYDDRYFAEEIYPDNDFLHPANRYLVVWDAKGNEVWRRKPLPGCAFGLINAIDDLGNIFATEECFAHGSLWSEGVRVTASGTETLKHWLEAAGAGSSLPLDLMVSGVSANGETIYGSEFNGIAVGSPAAGPTPSQTFAPNAPLGVRAGFASNVPFIAHVP